MHQEQIQLFIVNPVTNKTHVICINQNQFNSQIKDFKQNIIQQLNLKISADKFKIQTSNRILDDSLPIKIFENNQSLNIFLGGLKGGKGGFGSLLRQVANTKRKITNFDASRNLQGRRIRHVNYEKKLVEYYRKKKIEEQSVKKQINEMKSIDKEVNAAKGDIRLDKEFQQKLQQQENKISKAIKSSLIRKKISKDPQNLKLIKNHTEKQKQFNNDLEEEKTMESNKNFDDGDNIEVEEQFLLKEFMLPVQKQKQNHKQIKQEKKENDDKKETNSILQQVLENNKNLLQQEDQQQLESANTIDSSSDTVDIQSLSSIKLNNPTIFDEIDLNKINTVEDLEKFGLEHLKNELQRLGLKCGGNLRDRAQRLFDIKINPSNLFNPKYLQPMSKKK